MTRAGMGGAAARDGGVRSAGGARQPGGRAAAVRGPTLAGPATQAQAVNTSLRVRSIPTHDLHSPGRSQQIEAADEPLPDACRQESGRLLDDAAAEECRGRLHFRAATQDAGTFDIVPASLRRASTAILARVVPGSAACGPNAVVLRERQGLTRQISPSTSMYASAQHGCDYRRGARGACSLRPNRPCGMARWFQSVQDARARVERDLDCGGRPVSPRRLRRSRRPTSLPSWPAEARLPHPQGDPDPGRPPLPAGSHPRRAAARIGCAGDCSCGHGRTTT